MPTSAPRPATFEQYIASKSATLGLDPAAVLSIASVEGGLSGGSPGDHGTSFGPFQLHVGGKLPSNVKNPQTWAWSKEGIDYALTGIQRVAKGQKGHQAIASIASQFEQPQNVPAEIANADRRYLSFYHYDNPKGLPVLGGPLESPAVGLGDIGVGAGAAEAGAGAGAGLGLGKAIAAFLGSKAGKGAGILVFLAFLDSPEGRHLLTRVAEVVAGAGLFWIGLRMMGNAGMDATSSPRRQVSRAL